MGIFSSLKIFISSNKQLKHTTSEAGKINPDRTTSNNSNKWDSNHVSSNVNSPQKSIEISTGSSSGKNNTLTSSGYSFQYRDGRRYHAEVDVSYVLPNDDDEARRIDQQHWILRSALQCNYHSPIHRKLERGITCLDVGCGQGTWMLEMAETYPHTKFYGVDASCVFPQDNSKIPKNVEFAIANVAKEVPYQEDYFDYIHQRLLVLALTDEGWTAALKELHRVLKPGGYVELAEPDIQDMPNAGPAMQLLQSTISNMCKDCGFPPRIATELKRRLLRAGFVNVRIEVTEIPLNHTNRVGEFMWGDYRHAYLNIRSVMAKSNPEWENSELYESHIDACGKEAKDNKSCLKWYSVYARKPPKPHVDPIPELKLEDLAIAEVEK